MTQDLIVWDGAAGAAFLWWRTRGNDAVLHRRYPRRSFLTDFPVDLSRHAADLPSGADVRVLFGAGPGSFTGIKTGAALVGALLYARGIRRIELVSSLDILSLRMPPEEEVVTIVTIPFNERMSFLSAFERKGSAQRYLIAPRTIDHGLLLETLRPLVGRKVTILSDPEPPPALLAACTHLASQIETRLPAERPYTEDLAAIPVIATVDLAHDPLTLAYLVAPAGLPEDDAAYYISMNPTQEVRHATVQGRPVTGDREAPE